MRWLVLLALTGCFPTTTVRNVPYGRSYALPELVGPVTGVALDVTASYATLHVSAWRRRDCIREVKRHFMRRTETVSGGGSAILVPVASPILLVGIAVVALGGQTDRVQAELYEKTVDVQKRDCSLVAAMLAFDVALPSGAVVHAVTDAGGLAHVKIPAGEPARGVAIVRAANAVVRVAYAPGL